MLASLFCESDVAAAACSVGMRERLMYGMVHQAARDLATQELGGDGWKAVLESCGLDETHFISSDLYSDEVTFKLVGAICEIAQLAPADLLRTFGKHWVSYASKTSYGALMDQFGDDLESFVENLDDLHSRVQASMPGAQLPSFELVSATPQYLDVAYRSHREGLVPFVAGLLEGLMARFGETGTVTVLPGDDTIFRISDRSRS